MKLAYLDPDHYKSLTAWGTKLRCQGFSVFQYEQHPSGEWTIESNIGANQVEKSKGQADSNSRDEESQASDEQPMATGDGNRKFGFAFMPPWQQAMLQQFGAGVGLDATHGTTRGGAELYTIVVAHSTGKGIPVAFLLTNDHSSVTLGHWLSHIREHIMHCDGMGNRSCLLKTIVIDDSHIEKNAIVRAFGPGISIHLCLWHVQRSWSRKLPNKIQAVNADGTRITNVDRHGVMIILRAIMYEENPSNAILFIDILRKTLSRCEEYRDALKYLETFFFQEDKQKQWMRCFRKDVYWADVNTNNYVESWHSNLKKHFLRDNKKPRYDYLVFVLSSSAVRMYESEIYKTQLNLGRQSKATRESAQRLLFVKSCFYGKSLSESLRFFERDEATNQLWVKSFNPKTPEKRYEIKMNYTTIPPTIEGCECPDFSRRLLPCKHIYTTVYRFPTSECRIATTSMAPPAAALLQLAEENVVPEDALDLGGHEQQEEEREVQTRSIDPSSVRARAKALEMAQELLAHVHNKADSEMPTVLTALLQARDIIAPLAEKQQPNHRQNRQLQPLY